MQFHENSIHVKIKYLCLKYHKENFNLCFINSHKCSNLENTELKVICKELKKIPWKCKCNMKNHQFD